MGNKRIVILGGDNIFTNIVYNSLKDKYNIEKVILDSPVPKSKFLKRRIKRLGLIKVIGQLLFVLLCSKPLSLMSRQRVAEIIRDKKLNIGSIPEDKVVRGYSVNSEVVIDEIKNLKPDLIIVHGTRIISKKVLDSVSCKFINIHAGITPKYRGVHGMYWALVQNDKENCGVTVHFVDDKIDTGSIIYQAQVLPNENDNFTTYYYLQLSEGLKLLDKATEDCLNENVKLKNGTKESHLWYHPTIVEYLYNLIVKKIK